MDGVLVDVSASYRRAIEETAKLFTGRPVAEGAIQTYKNRGGFNDDWKLTYQIIRDAGVEARFEDVVEAFQIRYRGRTWDGFINDEPALVPTETLSALQARGLVMGVATGRPRDEAAWTIRKRGWEPFFSVLVAMEDQQGKGKPDPFCLLHALEELQRFGHAADASEAVYVGDTGDDMIAARAAGMTGIGMTPPYLDGAAHADVLRRAGARVVLTDGRDLPDAIERL